MQVSSHLRGVSLEAKAKERKKEVNRNALSPSRIIPHPTSVILFTLVKKDCIFQLKSQLKPVFSAFVLEAMMTKKKKRKARDSDIVLLKQIYGRCQVAASVTKA